MGALQIGLGALARGAITGELRLEEPAADLGELPIALEFLDIAFTVEREAGDAVRARGRLASKTEVECRRCLTPTPIVIETRWDALFRPPARVTPGEEGVWPLEAGAGELDLSGPIREELWVGAPEYVECGENCPGLCPRCGARLADESCTCPPGEPDPRWAVLKELGG